MKEKITSGEWVACIDYPSCWIDSADSGLIADLEMTDVECVGELYANAHLIAQSKNMYKLLERLERWGEIGNETLKGEIGLRLAKARGEL